MSLELSFSSCWAGIQFTFFCICFLYQPSRSAVVMLFFFLSDALPSGVQNLRCHGRFFLLSCWWTNFITGINGFFQSFLIWKKSIAYLPHAFMHCSTNCTSGMHWCWFHLEPWCWTSMEGKMTWEALDCGYKSIYILKEIVFLTVCWRHPFSLFPAASHGRALRKQPITFM